MNYSETLASWYLRLNGFFPIPNYVLHRKRDILEYSADCDLLAIRHPHVYEEIGGQPGDWDEQFRNFGIDIRRKTIGVIVEVKTGKPTRKLRENIIDSFGLDRLTYSVKRFGFWPPGEVEEICNQLNEHPHVDNGDFSVVKLLIADTVEPIAGLSMHQMNLRDIDAFIRRRFELYQQKFPDRHFFPSDLMQYLIWLSTPREH